MSEKARKPQIPKSARNVLSAKRVQSLVDPGLYADGGNLYLQIGKEGGKSWVFRYTIDGRMRNMGLGPFVDVSLAEARTKAAKYRQALREDIDPLEERRLLRAQRRQDESKRMTFKECAAAYIKAKAPDWTNAKHKDQWTNTLATYAEPHIGNLLVSTIETRDVLQCLEPIWLTKTETARRVRQRIERVLDWAHARGYRSGDNPAMWNGHLDTLLPESPDIVKHYSAMPYVDVHDFMLELRKVDTIAARALELTILTACRTGEILGAKWKEIRGDIWTIPEERMKGPKAKRKAHRVPLSKSAMKTIGRIPEITDYVFPGNRDNAHMSNMTMLKVLRSLPDGQKYTVHGFRSTFRDWAAENTAFPNHVQEMALAHTIKSDVEAAYRRGDLFDKRRKLMEAWAKYIDSRPAITSEVTRIGR